MPRAETQFGGARANQRANGRPTGILIGEKKCKELRKAAAIAEVIRGDVEQPAERPHVSPRRFFQAVLDDVTKPDELRGAAAKALAHFWPEKDPPPEVDLPFLPEELPPRLHEAFQEILLFAAHRKRRALW